MNAAPLGLLRVASVLLFGGSVAFACSWVLASKAALLRARFARYEAALARQLAFLRLPLRARGLAVAQASTLLVALVLLVWASYLLSSLALCAALAVSPLLQLMRARRVTSIEGQLDGFLATLASALRATPALGEALDHACVLTTAPVRDELELLIKEHRLGVPLDEALTRMAERIGSTAVSSLVSALRIGRACGGDMPTILDRAASVLREMARLEGVVRTKTAEGKAQAFVLALTPFPLIALLDGLNPGMLSPLVEGPKGFAVCAVAVALWIAAVVLARRFLDVDV